METGGSRGVNGVSKKIQHADPTRKVDREAIRKAEIADLMRADVNVEDFAESARQQKKVSDHEREKFGRSAKRASKRARVWKDKNGLVRIPAQPLPEPPYKTLEEEYEYTLVTPSPCHDEMIAQLRQILDLAEHREDLGAHFGEQVQAYMERHRGKVSRESRDQMHSMYAVVFGEVQLPENRWKDRLMEAVAHALRARYGDPRPADWDRAEIASVGVTRGSGGTTILPWLQKVCPYVPPRLTAAKSKPCSRAPH